ncbi:hypothetical protein KR093_004500, partial [Drosophila rubida]
NALVVGAPRIRQIRVKQMEHCRHTIEVENLKETPCYPDYSQSMDNSSYHHGHYKDDAVRITTESFTYKGGGFSINFPQNETEMERMLDKLYESRWVDRGTRMVVIEMNLFFDGTEMFKIVKIIFEQFPTGIIVPSCQTAYFALGYNIWHPIEIQSIIDAFERDPWAYVSLDNLLVYWNIYVIVMGAMTFCAWLKIIRFLAFHRTLNRLALTIQLSFKNILGFFFIYLVLLLAFGQMGKMLFSDNVDKFRTITTSVIVLMRILMTDVDYKEMYAAHPQLAPIYFVAIIVSIYGISLNLFVAIYLATYSQVKSETYVRDKQVWHMFAKGLRTYFTFWRKNRT